MPPQIQRSSTINAKYVAIVDHVIRFATSHFLLSTSDLSQQSVLENACL